MSVSPLLKSPLRELSFSIFDLYEKKILGYSIFLQVPVRLFGYCLVFSLSGRSVCLVVSSVWSFHLSGHFICLVFRLSGCPSVWLYFLHLAHLTLFLNGGSYGVLEEHHVWKTNKAGYTAQDAPSTRLKITRDGRTDGHTL